MENRKRNQLKITELKNTISDAKKKKKNQRMDSVSEPRW